MNLLQITDIPGGQAQMSWQQGAAIMRHCAPTPFSDPLSIEDRKELRWYLEEYIQFPYGAEQWRAGQVERKMEEWGESLFAQVFAKRDPDPDPRAFYQEAVRSGLDQCEVCISSDDPAFLNIPWELLRDPAPGRGNLAPLLAGLYRQRASQKIEDFPSLSMNEPFHILLVIARPFGDRDVSLRMVARPMLEALRPLRRRIHLEVLRPPTFDALQHKLNSCRGHYHLVHFDGHGVFQHPTDHAISQFAATADRGHLVFEKEDGSPDVVNSRDLGQTLAACKVPLFVLNACQSAEEGNADPFSSVASQLIAIGAKGVVAMSYSVYATTAAKFMQRFYESLVNRKSLAEAVAAGRCKLHAEPSRDSVVGPLDLRDWMVPALYQQEYRYVPIPAGEVEAGRQPEQKEQTTLDKAGAACPEGQFGFIGRDYDILRIERALRRDEQPWVVLTGIGGIGKTELAYGFARWYAETGGCPSGVFAAEFKKKADFSQIIGSIVGHGTDFSRLPDEEQFGRLVEFLRENACLLVWDNFEPVAGYPEGADALATDEEKQKLARFLKALKGGKSRVLITTRKPDEKWLGIAYSLIELRGLQHHDAAQLAKATLSTVGKRPEDFRNDPEYASLIRLLNGHPRSLEVVLPHLRSKSPVEIIHSLQHRVDSLGETIEDASLSYAFSLMSPRTQKHLPFIGLFASRIYLGTLANFVSDSDNDSQRKVYKEVIGESLSEQDWEAVLEEAGRAGLIRPMGNGIYELHPTLPPFLRRRLSSMVGENGVKRLDFEFMRFYAAWASHFLEDVRKGSQNAVTLVAIEEGNLLRALRFADSNDKWGACQAIAQTLSFFYEIAQRTEEAASLRDHMLTRIGEKISTDAGRDHADLWMFLLGEKAIEALDRNDLASAEAAYHSILDYLVILNDKSSEPNLASLYNQLGRIAQERQQFDEAEELYNKALEIRERLGPERKTAGIYHNLGVIAQERRDFEKADVLFKKALEIRERLALELDAASDYHHLGIIAQECQDFDKAEEWYKKALEVSERLGLERYAALDYNQLGMVAQKRRQFDKAEERYKKALQIFERLGLEREAADEYHNLGIIAHMRRQFDKAEQWYKKAMEVKERLGHPPLFVDTLARLGMLRGEQGRLGEAVMLLGKAHAIATKYRMRVGSQILTIIAKVMKSMGETEFTAAWNQAFPNQPPPLETLRETIRIIEQKDKS